MVIDDDEELTIDDLDDDLEEESEYGYGGSQPYSSAEGEDNSDEEPSWGPTIVVNNTTYAVSLFWQPLQDTSDPYPEVKETVENVMEKADLFCLRSGTSPQYGIGNSLEGHKAGMPSAAAIIAEKFQDRPSSVAVFEVDEGWWFIAVRNDLILSEEDILYLKEEDAKRAFFAMMAVPDWGRKIAPASWDIEGTEEVDLWDILKGSSSSKLMRINKTSQKTKMIALGAGALVLLIGFKLFSALFFPEKKNTLRPFAPLLPIEEEKEEEKPIEQKITYPWENLVVTQDLLRRCHTAAMQVKNIIVPGWRSGIMTCTASGLATSWTKQWGDLGWVKRAFEEYDIQGLDFAIDTAGSTVVASMPIGELALHSETPKMMTYEMREELTHIFQSINLPINLSEQKGLQTKTVNSNGLETDTVTVRTSYPELFFSFSSELPMEDWLEIFDKFPALEITRLQYVPESNVWTYEGHIYELIF